MSLDPPEHPLQHLSSVSAEGLRARAAIWRDAGHHDPDDAVKSLLLAAAADIEAADATFATLAAADAGTLRSDRAAVAAILEGTRISSSPDDLAAAAAALRSQGMPDDSGSTASHLEAASARIAGDARALAALKAAAASESFDATRIAELAAAAIPEDFAATCDAPPMRM